jgi:hypothetical protein
MNNWAKRSLQRGAAAVMLFGFITFTVRTVAGHEPAFGRPQIISLVAGAVGLFALIILWLLSSPGSKS